MHIYQFGGYVCFDYAAAGPHDEINMTNISVGKNASVGKEHLDAIYISPHKFPGGPGTPGILCIRKDFANCTNASLEAPTIAGGGTVTLVWPRDRAKYANTLSTFETALHIREEGGTPGVVESIRCGLVFYIKDIVGSKRITDIESKYAQNAVTRLKN